SDVCSADVEVREFSGSTTRSRDSTAPRWWRKSADSWTITDDLPCTHTHAGDWPWSSVRSEVGEQGTWPRSARSRGADGSSPGLLVRAGAERLVCECELPG